MKWEKDNTVDRTTIPPLANGDNANYPDRTKEAVQGVHMLTNETFELNYFPSVPNANQIDKETLSLQVLPLTFFLFSLSFAIK